MTQPIIAATEGIQDDSQIQKARPGRYISDVSDPKHIRCIRIEVAVDQITCRAGTRIAFSGHNELATTNAPQALGFHQMFDALAGDWEAIFRQFSVNARRAVGLL